jgi:hypothetical protein
MLRVPAKEADSPNVIEPLLLSFSFQPSTFTEVERHDVDAIAAVRPYQDFVVSEERCVRDP